MPESTPLQWRRILLIAVIWPIINIIMAGTILGVLYSPLGEALCGPPAGGGFGLGRIGWGWGCLGLRFIIAVLIYVLAVVGLLSLLSRRIQLWILQRRWIHLALAEVISIPITIGLLLPIFALSLDYLPFMGGVYAIGLFLIAGGIWKKRSKQSH